MEYLNLFFFCFVYVGQYKQLIINNLVFRYNMMKRLRRLMTSKNADYIVFLFKHFSAQELHPQEDGVEKKIETWNCIQILSKY